ncbi:sulfotransferase domain-containing protein [Pseudomonas sp. 8O]|uniref:sulfotransferase domain-containing protein n=1 Tax=Pseudomonas sp. 8O TaxID=2653165 RepID=UPI0012EF63B6
MNLDRHAISLNTRQPKMKVNFIIVGAQKCGTTALHESLIKHPSIFIPKKEIHYFDNKSIYENDINYQNYHSHFLEYKKQSAIGEATPIYLYWNGALDRIKKYNDKIKIIVVLRNPIERAFSHWNMERNRGNENLTFLEAITCEAHRCAEALPEQHRIYSYVDRGHYIKQLNKLWDIFNKEQTLIIDSGRLKNYQRETLLEIHNFLGIESSENTGSLPHAPPNSTPRSIYKLDV